MLFFFFFFFFSSRRRHTRSLCDWSSDVCSSDLEQATTEGLFARPMHPYTVALLEALPELAARRGDRRLVPVKGQPPDLAALPAGCPFAPRCRHAEDDPESRREVSMALLELAPDHLTA